MEAVVKDPHVGPSRSAATYPLAQRGHERLCPHAPIAQHTGQLKGVLRSLISLRASLVQHGCALPQDAHQIVAISIDAKGTIEKPQRGPDDG